MSFMLVAPSTIATPMETSAIPRSTSGNFRARTNANPSAPVSPTWSASLRSSTAPACPASPSASAVTLSAWSHGVSFIAKSAPAWGSEWCGYRVISQNGAFFAAEPVALTAASPPASPARLQARPADAYRTHQVRAPNGYQPATRQEIAVQSDEETITPRSAGQC